MKKIYIITMVFFLIGCARPFPFKGITQSPMLDCPKSIESLNNYKRVIIKPIYRPSDGWKDEYARISVVNAFTQEGFEIIDRDDIRRIVSEQRLANSGITKGGKHTGQIFEADAIVQVVTHKIYGKQIDFYGKYGSTNYCKLLVKIISIETGKVTHSCTGYWEYYGFDMETMTKDVMVEIIRSLK